MKTGWVGESLAIAGGADADGRTPSPNPRRIDPCAGRRAMSGILTVTPYTAAAATAAAAAAAVVAAAAAAGQQRAAARAHRSQSGPV